MKKTISLLLACLMLTGCGSKNTEETTLPVTVLTEPALAETVPEIVWESRFDSVTEITLSDDGILVNGGEETAAVFTTDDMIYYEDRETYDSGNPYGEGEDHERHTAEEAIAHTVVNITQPGAYRVSGKLSAGQIRIDLGEDSHENPDAVVELILEDTDVTCTVAPAILFRNVYECDGDRDAENATPEVDTSAAGANLILEGSNTVNGSHVAKIFRDQEEEKKLWKQDGAIYSYQSMNVFGPGSLELTADNEGLDTEKHLTINGGNIRICSDNDGINTNEDGVSVTTINGGSLTIYAGLGEEGDGIDSNGYLVINGGTVMASAKPASDAGLDSDLGSFIHGGTVIAMGSTMDWAESDSNQVTMNLQFANREQAGSKIVITKEDGTEIFSFEDDSTHSRSFSGLILSHPYFKQGETYHIYVDGVQMGYTGTDVGMFGPGGSPMGNPGDMPEGGWPVDEEHPEPARTDFPEGAVPGQMPEDFDPQNLPEDSDPTKMGGRGQRPGDADMTPPEGFDGEMPAMPEGEMPQGGFPGREGMQESGGVFRTDFYMNDKVNAFSGVMPGADATE